MFITSTVCSVILHTPPATIRAVPVHSAVDPNRLVGIGGNFSVHLLTLPSAVRLNSLLVVTPLLSPPTRVRSLLTMTEGQLEVGQSAS